MVTNENPFIKKEWFKLLDAPRCWITTTPEGAAHHDAAKQTDASAAIGVGHDISVAHAQKGNGNEPKTIQDIPIFLIMIPTIGNA